MFLAPLKLRASLYERADGTLMSWVGISTPALPELFSSRGSPGRSAGPCWGSSPCSIRARQRAGSSLFLWLLSLIDICLFWSLARPILARRGFYPSFRAARPNPMCVDPSERKAEGSHAVSLCPGLRGFLRALQPSVGTSDSIR